MSLQLVTTSPLWLTNVVLKFSKISGKKEVDFGQSEKFPDITINLKGSRQEKKSQGTGKKEPVFENFIKKLKSGRQTLSIVFLDIRKVVQRSIVMWEVAILKDSHKSLTDYEDYFNQNIEQPGFLVASISFWNLCRVPLGV